MVKKKIECQQLPMNLNAQITVKILRADSQSCSANTCWDTLNKTHCLLLRCQGK